ncbi:unnamed protein product [Adineta steineri]|uniref:SCP domain-containing protein n=1 Tax=Adineta steineri TaxID=433720 RepID=A0A816DLT0_9BILA|nr:unnamed protein product [Adineta steineri]CAF1495584.1 unnamed protein product [Adineta steineri]CAF1639072.1 unnamed protein product [Adineta steineri]CAF3635424.1 unnamed protein product [Adineta steineri]
MSGAAVIRSHNRYRRSANLAPLAASQRLRHAAQSHANYMAQTRQMSHQENVNGRGTVSERVTQTGFRWSGVAENVAAGHTTTDDVMTAWMNSPGHKQNILNGNYTRIGIGSRRGADNLIYWCAVFAR